MEQSQESSAANEGEELEVVALLRSKRLASMLERKRKAIEPSSTQTERAELELLEEDPPRPPSHHREKERWSWQSHVVDSLINRQELEHTMIHPDEDSSQAPNLVLGSLKEVGALHGFLQNSSANNDEEEEMTDKRQRRLVRKARKERLFPHVEEKEPKRNWSKVAWTVGNQEHWLELDMGECLVEVVAPDSSKTLCAFSSLEIALKDEDASSSA